MLSRVCPFNSSKTFSFTLLAPLCVTIKRNQYCNWINSPILFTNCSPLAGVTRVCNCSLEQYNDRWRQVLKKSEMLISTTTYLWHCLLCAIICRYCRERWCRKMKLVKYVVSVVLQYYIYCGWLKWSCSASCSCFIRQLWSVISSSFWTFPAWTSVHTHTLQLITTNISSFNLSHLYCAVLSTDFALLAQRLSSMFYWINQIEALTLYRVQSDIICRFDDQCWDCNKLSCPITSSVFTTSMTESAQTAQTALNCWTSWK